VRSAALRHRRAADGEDDFARRAWHLSLLRLVLRRPRDSLAVIAAAAVVTAIAVNGLFLQKGPHPAPIFPIKPLPVVGSESTNAISLPRPRPAEPDALRREPGRPRAEIVTDIQRELARRGYYDGAADGVYGAKTDAAIRDFEQVAGLKPSTELGETLLAAIMRAGAKPKALPPAAAARKDPIADLIAQRPVQQAAMQPQPVPPAPLPQPRQEPAPSLASLHVSPKVLAVQRALSDFGYGQIRPTGLYDADTKLAIQRFERDRRLPITGEMSDRVLRELAALTGRPLD